MFCKKVDVDFNFVGNSISFLFNGYSIENQDYYKTLEQLGITKFAKILVIDHHNIIGSGPKMVDFVDVSTGKIKK